MRELTENVGIVDCLAEFNALTWILHNEDSDWYAGVSNDYSVIGRYTQYAAGLEFREVERPDELILLAGSASHMLNAAATAGKRYRQKVLHPREILSIRSTHKRLMAAIDDYLEKSYSHSLSDVPYLGR
jgi:predicted GIY-YIG superfamily endonuclease